MYLLGFLPVISVFQKLSDVSCLPRPGYGLVELSVFSGNLQDAFILPSVLLMIALSLEICSFICSLLKSKIKIVLIPSHERKF